MNSSRRHCRCSFQKSHCHLWWRGIQFGPKDIWRQNNTSVCDKTTKSEEFWSEAFMTIIWAHLTNPRRAMISAWLSLTTSPTTEQEHKLIESEHTDRFLASKSTKHKVGRDPMYYRFQTFCSGWGIWIQFPEKRQRTLKCRKENFQWESWQAQSASNKTQPFSKKNY